MWFIFVQLLGLIPSLIAITSLGGRNRRGHQLHWHSAGAAVPL